MSVTYSPWYTRDCIPEYNDRIRCEACGRTVKKINFEKHIATRSHKIASGLLVEEKPQLVLDHTPNYYFARKFTHTNKDDMFNWLEPVFHKGENFRQTGSYSIADQ